MADVNSGSHRLLLLSGVIWWQMTEGIIKEFNSKILNTKILMDLQSNEDSLCLIDSEMS